MGMFAERANVNYHLSFANQGKQTSAFRFRFPYLYINQNDSLYRWAKDC
jgi:hypothetical protein